MNEKFICEKCNKIFNNKYLLKRHMENNSCKILYICKKCNRQFKSITQYNHHKTIDCLNTKFFCEFCNKQFKNQNGLTLHLFSNHKDKIKINYIKCKNKECNNLIEQIQVGNYIKPYRETCSDKCLKKLLSYYSSIVEEKPYKCQACNTGFINELQLNKHFNKKHVNYNYKFICVICNAYFANKAQLHEHYNVFHKDLIYINKTKCENSKCNNYCNNIMVKNYIIKEKKFCSRNCANVINGTKGANKFWQNNPKNIERRYNLTLQHNGTCKWYTYIDRNNNKYKVQGTYELAYAKKLDEINEKFVTHPKGIKYNNNGRTTYYFPDFYLPDKNIYVDVKSTYYLNLSGNKFDLLKTQHPEINIIIITEKEFKDLGIDNIYNYIKDLIR